MEVPYILQNGKTDFVASAVPLHWSQYPREGEPTVKNHDFSVKIYISPWITVPLSSVDKIIDIVVSDASRVVHISSQEKKVRQVLQSKDISQRLQDASSEGNKACWIEGFKEHEREVAPYFCFNGALFIAFLWTSNNPGITPVSLNDKIISRFTKYYQETAPQQLYHMYGVFLCEATFNVEGHGFVIYITDDVVTIYNTYGGTLGIFITDFIKKPWIDPL